ncbi:MAG: hypothetical protein C0402_13485 [Thermodesulfovibrio sp.]|nr:hypothetical protein [Thermodesulfovibrio sp.]
MLKECAVFFVCFFLWGFSPAYLSTVSEADAAMTLGGSDYVGVGVAVPEFPLDISLARGIFSHARFGATKPLVLMSNESEVGFNLFYEGAYKYASDGYGGSLLLSGGGFRFATAPSGSANAVATMNTRVLITNDGKVGIGTVTPDEVLDVVGNIKVNGSIINDNGISATSNGPVAGSFVNTSAAGKALSATVNGTEVMSADQNGLHATAISYTAPRTRHWSIAGSEFIPLEDTAAYTKINGSLYGTTNYFSAPVHLPDGATVTSMKVHFWDNAAGAVWVFLDRLSMTETFDNMAVLISNNTGASFVSQSTNSVNYPIIDNSAFAYQLNLSRMDGSSNQRLGGVVLSYTVTEPLP